jgi:hypothetical protein
MERGEADRRGSSKTAMCGQSRQSRLSVFLSTFNPSNVEGIGSPWTAWTERATARRTTAYGRGLAGLGMPRFDLDDGAPSLNATLSTDSRFT